jgi:hypothetical protein
MSNVNSGRELYQISTTSESTDANEYDDSL